MNPPTGPPQASPDSPPELAEHLTSTTDPALQSLLRTAPSRPYTPSPTAWEDLVLYFLLPDRFSNALEQHRDIPTTQQRTPPYTPSAAGSVLRPPNSAQKWRDAGARFVGGTLAGVRSKLGYLSRLGVGGVWLGPVLKQVRGLETYHGYGVQDFLAVESRLGTREELREVVREAHRVGICVVLDVILNHAGDVFAYEKERPVYDGREYKVKGWYDARRKAEIAFGRGEVGKVKGVYPDGAVWPVELQDPSCWTRKGRIRDWDKAPEYLEGDFFGLKALSLGAHAVDKFVPTPTLKALVEVYKFWIAYADLDGLRIDTVKHMGHGPTRYFTSCIKEFAQALGKDNFLMVGEIAGAGAFETVEVTGLDAALGIGHMQEALWKVPKGLEDPSKYFSLFRNAPYKEKGSGPWFRNKIVTMIDDHDQIWRLTSKGRFCSDPVGQKLICAALALNLCTLGIPCIYYGTEQGFDGAGGSGSQGHHSDQYIREAMFGGEFGAFRTRDVHFFLEDSEIYRFIANIVKLRSEHIALRRGRQFLREVSSTGIRWGYPKIKGQRRRGIVAWSRVFNEVELLCAISTDPDKATVAWVEVDPRMSAEGSTLGCLYPGGDDVTVQRRGGRAMVKLIVEAGKFVVYGQSSHVAVSSKI
ncbi:alpha-amylase [Trichodelitschia bisporula]|uniref:Alpha-amylase n=1 Tax=Trichodelitschia bisporula TaxID=703511 RepID=A0A6G1HSZ0_9PEZI|nr:alpha-amylase [Trichodelitschia bisporula]